ncbi:hypothetical protein [Desulfonatronum parangueonense]
MTPMIPVAMFGWLPFSIWLFSKLQARHAVIAGFLLSWMFLPQYSYNFSGIPDYTKVSAMSYGVLLGTLFFNSEAFSRFRPHVLDLPLVIWCVIPFFTSLSNGLGAYDGLSTTLARSTMWGLPYFIGRLYFYNRQALTELAFGIFLGGLIYIPFCLWEVVMSPRLHRIVYGFHPHSFGQTKRGGGWRPVVFMEHGLMVAMWMVTAWLSGYQLWKSGWLGRKFPRWKQLWGPVVLGLLVTVVLCKSTGALGLLVFGVFVLYLVQLTRWALPMKIVLLLPILYVLARGSGYWDAQNLIDAAGRIASEDRTASLAYRLQNENILSDRALERAWLGWGEWGRSFVRDEDGRAISVPDGLWILAFGQNGIVGLSALLVTLLLPPLLFLIRYPPRRWRDPPVAAMTSLPLLMGLFTIDSLFNAMFNPLILILAGGLTGLWLEGPETDAAFAASTAPHPVEPRTRLF